MAPLLHGWIGAVLQPLVLIQHFNAVIFIGRRLSWRRDLSPRIASGHRHGDEPDKRHEMQNPGRRERLHQKVALFNPRGGAAADDRLSTPDGKSWFEAQLFGWLP